MPIEDFVPFSAFVEQLAQLDGLPLDKLIAPLEDVDLLDQVGLTAYEGSDSGSLQTEDITLAFLKEFSFELVGISGLAVVLGGTGGITEIPLSVTVDTADNFAFVEASLTANVSFRFPATWLKPMMKSGVDWVEDTSVPYREIVYDGTLLIDPNGISFQGTNSFSLPPSMIGETGVIIEATDVRIVLSDADIPAGAPSGFTRGVYFESATLSMQDPDFPVQGITVSEAFVGSGGFTAHVDADLSLSGSLAGFDFTLTHFGVDFEQNALTGSRIAGTVTVPFFDSPLEVELALSG